MTGAADSAAGITGYALETTPGTYAAPTRWLYTENNTFAVKWDKASKKLHSGNYGADRFRKLTKGQVAGGVGFPLGPNHGAPLLKAVFGANVYLTALAADTVKTATPVTTANGLSTINLTNTAAVTYTPGAWVSVGAGSTTEMRQIVSISGNTAAGTIITVGALVANAAAAAGTAVQQVGQIKFSNALTSRTLPTVSVEDNRAGQFAYQLPNGMVDKFQLKAGKETIDATVDLFFSLAGNPVKVSPTTPAPTAGEIADLQAPFSIDGYQFVGYQDPLQSGGVTGTSTQQLETYIEDFNFEYDNTLTKKPLADLSRFYKAFRGIATGKIDYTYVNVSGRKAEFEDYLEAAKNNTIPFFAGFVVGTSALGLYIPTVFLDDYTDVDKVGDVLSAKVMGDILPSGSSGDLVQAFVVNNDTAAY